MRKGPVMGGHVAYVENWKKASLLEHREQRVAHCRVSVETLGRIQMRQGPRGHKNCVLYLRAIRRHFLSVLNRVI